MKQILSTIAAAVVLVAAFLFGAFVWVTDSYIDQRYATVLSQMEPPLPQTLSDAVRIQMGDRVAWALAMNCFYPPSRTLRRQLREILVSYRLRQRFSDAELVSLYGHTVFLGHTETRDVIGFDNAAKTYLKKDPRTLTPAEAAWLTVLSSRPNFYLNHPDQALDARNALLDKMVSAHLVGEAEGTAAHAEPIPSARSAPLR